MRHILAVLILCSICGMCYASDLDSLKKEFDGLYQKRQVLAQQIQEIDVRIIELQGVAKYLTDKDKKTGDYTTANDKVTLNKTIMGK